MTFRWNSDLISTAFASTAVLFPSNVSMPSPVSVALTIAGFDPSSGAGITADLAVFAAHGLFGTSAITVLTAQSTLGVAATEPVSAAFLDQMLVHLGADLPPDGIKIGALGSADVAATVGNRLLDFEAHWDEMAQIPIIFDPVLRSSSGVALFPEDQIPLLHERLLPAVTWITPNWQELALLTGREVRTASQAECAADTLAAAHPQLNIVVTGGDQEQPIDLLRTLEGSFYHLEGEHVESDATHGTGCAFSSALLANLMLDKSPLAAATAAKQYVVEAIRRAPGLGSGRGPLHLLWPLDR